jgi:two-component system cell cycle response regulator DivK
MSTRSDERHHTSAPSDLSPRPRRDSSRRRRPESSAASYGDEAGTGLRKRARPIVLFVDDNPEELTIYRACAEAQGYAVEVLPNGEEAVTVTYVLQPHVVVMDLMMPVMDGWEATRRLKHDPRTKHIPVIILTGAPASGTMAKAREVSADRLLWKPCLPEELVAAIEIARGEVAPPA